MISEAASTPQALAYLAGQIGSAASAGEFNALITNLTSVLHAATEEIEAMIGGDKPAAGAMLERLEYSLAILCPLDAKPGMKSC
jgi:hypothetical protein